MWAVLPAKDFADAKQRLAAVLLPEERRWLFRAMYADMLDTLASVAALEGFVVVTGELEAAAMAEACGGRIFHEDTNRGQSAAVEHAAAALARAGVEGIVTVPGDAPLATAEEIAAVLAAHGAAPAMTIVPSHDRRGSNCIAVSPSRLIPFGFGHDSFQPHLAAAKERGVEPRVIELAGIALDIDTPADLRTLLGRPAETRTHAYLNESGIAARLHRDERVAAGAR
jgi:2-phospho-L-lactate guanylyltransferase